MAHKSKSWWFNSKPSMYVSSPHVWSFLIIYGCTGFLQSPNTSIWQISWTPCIRYYSTVTLFCLHKRAFFCSGLLNTVDLSKLLTYFSCVVYMMLWIYGW
jgi:hypothetical protein